MAFQKINNSDYVTFLGLEKEFPGITFFKNYGNQNSVSIR